MVDQPSVTPPKPEPPRHGHFFAVFLAITATAALSTIFVFNSLTTSSNAAAAPGTVTLIATEDATVSLGFQAKNYGTDRELKVDSGKDAYLKFDLTGLISKPIHKATLRLFITDDSKSSQYIREAVSNDWKEATITYTTKPLSGDSAALLFDTTRGTWKDIDVTSLISGQAGKIISLAITETRTSPDLMNNLYFSSKEGDNPPKLVIETSTAEKN